MPTVWNVPTRSVPAAPWRSASRSDRCAAGLAGRDAARGGDRRGGGTAGARAGGRRPARGLRALVQRVSRAAVRVGGDEIAAIGPGLLVLLGVTHDDDEEVADRMAAKLSALRIFEDADGRMNDPLGDVRDVLCISQFTLYGDARKGNRPAFVAAARPEQAEPLYERVCAALGAKRGVFGAKMEVELVNDGPVTLLVELGPR